MKHASCEVDTPPGILYIHASLHHYKIRNKVVHQFQNVFNYFYIQTSVSTINSHYSVLVLQYVIVSFSQCSVRQACSLGAHDTGQSLATIVGWAMDTSAGGSHMIEQGSALIPSRSWSRFLIFVDAYKLASTLVTIVFSHNVSIILPCPTTRTFCDCWNHLLGRSTRNVADSTRCIMVMNAYNWMFILRSVEERNGPFVFGVEGCVVWLFWETEEVCTTARKSVMCSGHSSKVDTLCSFRTFVATPSGVGHTNTPCFGVGNFGRICSH